MDLLKKTLFGVFVVLVYFFLLGTSFDLMTKPNTISNILGFIGLTLLITIGMVFLYNAVKLSFSKSEEEKQRDEEWKEHILKQMEMMQKMHTQNEHIKKKSNPKQFDGAESDKPFVKTRKKTNKTK
jgi:putative Mn2+ efflux pump MntP